MSAKEQQDTERLIKETAKRVFFGEGRFNATTQEIADAAGVNRTLINYYFRSRDKLFEQVFEEAQIKEIAITEMILFSDVSLKDKVQRYLDIFFEQAKQYPYLEMYMVTQMNQGNCYKDHETMNKMLSRFYEEIQDEMDKGNIEQMMPEQFVLNLISLTSFPVTMRPLLQSNMGITSEKFDLILEERKHVILNILFKQ